MVCLLVFAALGCMLTGCGGTRHDPRLERISGVVSDHPEAALDSLALIDTHSLSDKDRHYHDFLTIKGRDKAYITHTSDSLVLDVIDYAGAHKSEGGYAEALYYGGRVYSDLGDLPTALRYFEQALDVHSKGPEDTLIKGNIESQTGRLLERIRLYDQAVPYLKESIELSTELGNDFNTAFNYQLLGTVYMHQKKFDEADRCFDQALHIADSLSDQDLAFFQGNKAICKYLQNQKDSAVYFIKSVPERVYDADKYYFASYASDIYRSAGLSDSAYFYAKATIENPNPRDRITGYKNLLSDILRDRIPKEDLPVMYNDYLMALESNYNQHDAESIMLQNSLFNYTRHQQENEKLKEKIHRLIFISFIFLILSLASISIIFIYKYRLALKAGKLKDALATIQSLSQQLGLTTADNDPFYKLGSIENMQRQLDVEIDRLADAAKSMDSIPNDATDTEGYKGVCRLIENDKILIDTDPLWGVIKRSINDLTPDFEGVLRRLSGHRLNEQDFQTAVLIRLGFSSTQISKVLGRSKGAITYRRKQLCTRVFHNKAQPDQLSNILRLL